MLHALAALSLLAALGVPGEVEAGFSPGEETVFQVSYLRIPTGEARVTVGKAEGDIWPVIFQARTGGIASLLDIREHMVSYWDHVQKLSRGSDLRSYEVGDLHTDSTRFDRANGKATVTVSRKGKQKVKVVDVPPDVHELTSAFMYLRLQPLEVGQRHELPVLASTKPFTLVVEILGRETVKVPAGAFPTLKIRVHTQIQGKFSTSRPSFMWVTDDPRHLLVRMEADFAVGSVVVALKKYTPGIGVTADAR
jgi:hypothetical protein